MKKWIAACLTGILLISTAMISAAAEPWSKVGENFISSDGKVIEGALEKGITISSYQNRAGVINWKKMAKQNITFAMIRLGYMDEEDPYFDVNMKNSTSHGLKTGVVFFSKALSVKEAEKEAEYVLEIIKDYDVSYPVAYSIEGQYMLNHKRNRKLITNQVNAFCKVISDAGYCPVVYGDYETLTKAMDTENIPYDIWYERYGVGNIYANRTMWQCTDSAKVDGIGSLVCLEFSFADYKEKFSGTGWRLINGIWYYYVDYKLVRADTLTIDGMDYNFGPNGACINRVEKTRKRYQ